MQIKKPFEFVYGFKSHCTSINECFYKLEGCLQLRPNIKRKTFPPFGNEFLPPSKTISLTCWPIIYPLKQKDLCDYYPSCIISSGFMFDHIIMNIMRIKKLERHNEEAGFFNKDWKQKIICTGGHFKTFTEKWNTRVSRCSMCTFPYKNNRYETLFDPHIKKIHLKWWYEWKGIPLVGFLSKFPQEVYYYVFRMI